MNEGQTAEHLCAFKCREWTVEKKDRGGEGGEASARLPAAKTQSCASALYKTPSWK